VIKAKVSIGMPLDNAERYLERALEALLAQTFTDFELTMSDNTSTDSAREICSFFQVRNQQIKLYRHENNQAARKNLPRVLFSEEAIAQALTAHYESLRL
jgi:glycosyltransferase involved in cell wall biosynthesis